MDLKIYNFAKKNFGAQLKEHFLKRKELLDKYTFNILRVKDKDFRNDDLDTIDLYLRILTSNFNTSFKCQFVDAAPISLSTLEFSTDQTDVQYLIAEATFRYVYFKLTNKNDTELTL